MPRVVRLIAVCLAIGFCWFALDAYAGTVNLGFHSKGEITATCAKVGGTMFSGADGEYGCNKGGNMVDCGGDTGQCTGSCPKCGARHQ